MYDFDEEVNRRNTNAVKWNGSENELPMWIADMDFETAPEIIEALHRRVDHGVFGYTQLPNEWEESYQNWWEMRHQYEMRKDSLIFCTGVLPILANSLKILTQEGDQVIVQSPVYFRFFQIIEKLNRKVIENPLIYQNQSYAIDYQDLEEKLSDEKTKVLFLCNPHNPVGRCWTKDELEQIATLCEKYDVTVVSDEIHCDLTDPLIRYTPFASISENSITCIAPTKAFNLAGIHTAAAYVTNASLKEKLEVSLEEDNVSEPNCFAVTSTIAAYTHGAKWLDALREYIFENKIYAQTYIEENIPGLSVIRGNATYLLWIDCREYGESAGILTETIHKNTGLRLSAGNAYGKDGEYFLRMNVACTRKNLEDGLKRLKNALENKNHI